MTWRILMGIILAASLLSGPMTASAVTTLDFAIPNGHFYTQANGAGGQGGTGYAKKEPVYHHSQSAGAHRARDPRPQVYVTVS